MDSITSLFPGPRPAASSRGNQAVYEGRFSRTLTTQFEGAFFYIDAFDDGVGEFGPCPWPVRTVEYGETGDLTADIVTRHLFPVVGDRCWVTFVGEGNDPLILQWWPLGRGFQDTRV